MTPAEYMDAAKQVMGIKADNELANRFEINRSRVSAYRAGREWPDYYIVTKLAITLKLDPATVLADLESQRERNPKRAEFWRSFLSRAAMLGLLVCTLALSSSGICELGQGPLGGLIAASAAFFYAVRVRIIGDYDNPRTSNRDERLQQIMAP